MRKHANQSRRASITSQSQRTGKIPQSQRIGKIWLNSNKSIVALEELKNNEDITYKQKIVLKYIIDIQKQIFDLSVED